MAIREPVRGAGFALVVLLMNAGMAAGAGAQYASNGMGGASPAAVYLHYIKVLKNAKSLKELFQFSPNPDAQNKQDLANLSPEQRKQGLAAIRVASLDPEGAKVVSESIDGDTATLEASGVALNPMSGKREPVWGTVEMVRREGEWKIVNRDLRDTEKPSEN